MSCLSFQVCWGMLRCDVTLAAVWEVQCLLQVSARDLPKSWNDVHNIIFEKYTVTEHFCIIIILAHKITEASRTTSTCPFLYGPRKLLWWNQTLKHWEYYFVGFWCYDIKRLLLNVHSYTKVTTSKHLVLSFITLRTWKVTKPFFLIYSMQNSLYRTKIWG